MNNSEQVEAAEAEMAEAKMNDAREELLTYVERREDLDPVHYRRLVSKVKRAEVDFLRVASDR